MTADDGIVCRPRPSSADMPSSAGEDGTDGFGSVLQILRTGRLTTLKGAGQLLAVWNAFPDEVKQVPPAIVLVVPINIKAQYITQRIDPVNSPLNHGYDDPSNWPQFVLGLGDSMLWGVQSSVWKPVTVTTCKRVCSNP
jgi:hypothetical protein